MNFPLAVLAGLSVLYLVSLMVSGHYFVKFFKTHDKCSLSMALLGVLGVPGLALLGLIVGLLIVKYTGFGGPFPVVGEPCGLLYPCKENAHKFRDQIILAATGIAYLLSLVFSVGSFLRFYRTKDRCSLWLSLLLLTGLPGILVLYGLFDYFVLHR